MAQAQAPQVDQVEKTDEPQEDQQQDQESGEEESSEGGEEEDPPAEGEGEQPEEDVEDESDEVVVSIGDEQPPEEQPKSAAEWVRELRKSYKETAARNRELEKELEALKAKPASKEEPALGEEPNIEDFEWDQDKFKEAYRAWTQRKQEHDAREARKQTEGAEQQKAWQAELDRYGKLKGELKVRDFDETEAKFAAIFSGPQQSMVVDACTNPAVVVYALGKNAAKAKELASIKSPAKFIAAVAKLEDKMKVTPRKAQTLPEAPVKSNAPVSGTIDSQLERLRADARRTGDYSKVSEYTRNAQAKKRA